MCRQCLAKAVRDRTKCARARVAKGCVASAPHPRYEEWTFARNIGHGCDIGSISGLKNLALGILNAAKPQSAWLCPMRPVHAYQAGPPPSPRANEVAPMDSCASKSDRGAYANGGPSAECASCRLRRSFSKKKAKRLRDHSGIVRDAFIAKARPVRRLRPNALAARVAIQGDCVGSAAKPSLPGMRLLPCKHRARMRYWVNKRAKELDALGVLQMRPAPQSRWLCPKPQVHAGQAGPRAPISGPTRNIFGHVTPLYSCASADGGQP